MDNIEQKLLNIKSIAESFNKENQIEIFKILKSHNVVINEDKTCGTSKINLSTLDVDVIEKLENFINFINEQTAFIEQTEKMKQSFQDEFFNESETILENFKSNVWNNTEELNGSTNYTYI
jgi:hypothetical protein